MARNEGNDKKMKEYNHHILTFSLNSANILILMCNVHKNLSKNIHEHVQNQVVYVRKKMTRLKPPNVSRKYLIPFPAQ